MTRLVESKITQSSQSLLAVVFIDLELYSNRVLDGRGWRDRQTERERSVFQPPQVVPEGTMTSHASRTFLTACLSTNDMTGPVAREQMQGNCADCTELQHGLGFEGTGSEPINRPGTTYALQLFTSSSILASHDASSSLLLAPLRVLCPLRAASTQMSMVMKTSVRMRL